MSKRLKYRKKTQGVVAQLLAVPCQRKKQSLKEKSWK